MPPVSGPAPFLFAILGLTGSGRSSFVNAILGREEAAVASGQESCTVEVGQYDYVHRERVKVHIIDTPGFNEYSAKAARSDEQILKSINSFLKAEYNANQRLSGIILLQSITATEIVNWETKQRSWALFKKLCGTESLLNVVVVTTFWDNLAKPEDGEEREKRLQTHEGLLKELYAKGTKFARFGRFEPGQHGNDPLFPTPQEILDILLAPLAGPTLQEPQGEIEGIRRRLESVERANHQYRESLDQKVERTEKSLGDIQEEGDKLQGRLVSLEEQQAQFATKAELNALEMRHQEALGGIQHKVSELQKANDKRSEDDQQRIEDLTKELDKVRQHRDALDKECKELRAKLEGALDDRFKGLETSLFQATSSYAGTLETLQASLRHAREDHAETKKELSSFKELHHKAHEDLEELKTWRRSGWLERAGSACILQ